MLRFIGLVSILVLAFLSFRITFSDRKPDETVTSDGMEEYRPQGLKNVVRRVASTASPTPARDERSPVERKRNDETFKDYRKDKTENDLDSESEYISGQSGAETEILTDSNSERRSRRYREISGSPLLRNKSETQGSENSPQSPYPTVGYGASSSPAPTTTSPPPSTENTGSVTRSRLECSSNIGGGTYSTALSLSFSCSTAATISYCIAEGTCCSPSTGSTYSTPVSLGASGTSYCVSFSGTDAFGNSSNTIQQTYTFNTINPDIQVVHQKIWYQTTELDGKLSMGSNDYGEATIEGGVLNFQSTDPVLAGYTTCAEQIEDTTPLAPLSIMPQTNLGHLTSGMQLDVYYSSLKLVYGDNYITSYLLSTAVAGSYSCNTTKIHLEDFPYFETTPTISMTTGSVHEFAGSFTPVSFFEAPAPSITRSPAGSSTENEGGQELREGLFGVFY